MRACASSALAAATAAEGGGQSKPAPAVAAARKIGHPAGRCAPPARAVEATAPWHAAALPVSRSTAQGPMRPKAAPAHRMPQHDSISRVRNGPQHWDGAGHVRARPGPPDDAGGRHGGCGRRARVRPRSPGRCGVQRVRPAPGRVRPGLAPGSSARRRPARPFAPARRIARRPAGRAGGLVLCGRSARRGRAPLSGFRRARQGPRPAGPAPFAFRTRGLPPLASDHAMQLVKGLVGGLFQL